ncbi:IS110 family transposase [Moraxella lacunata]|uniref:IS110 family transposase n=1 Tax=Moraxella lacunata TaxID=477 RepID=UPI003EE1066D
MRLLKQTLHKQGKRQMIHYIGIDISKAKFDVAFINPSTNKVKTKVFNNNKAGFDLLLAWLKTNVSNHLDELHIILEATGVYHEHLSEFLDDNNIKQSIVNPNYVRKFADSLGVIHKTDKKDSIILSRYGYSHKPEVWVAPSIEAKQLKALLARLEALKEDLQREQNRQELLLSPNLPDLVKASMQTVISVLQEEIAKLTKDIDDFVDKQPSLKQDKTLLETIDGIGSVIAKEVVCLMHTKQFKKASQMASFLGLIPKQRQSGVFKGATKLSKQGQVSLRAKLYMSAMSAIRYNSTIKAFYERLQQNGKTKMQALCACMRKLVHICFGVIKTQTSFEQQVSLS